MKRKFFCLIALVCVLLASAALTACGGKKYELETQYDWKYVKEFTDEIDSDMKIDGVLDESRWTGKKYLTHVQKGVEMRYTTVFTEKGLYVGAVVKDEYLTYSARFNFSASTANPANSAFWFNIKGPSVRDAHAMRSFNFYVDAFDKASRNQTRFDAASSVNGDILSGQANEMTSELFVSWDALNIDTEEGLPEFVRIVPSYRYVKSAVDAGENAWLRPLFEYTDVGWNYSMTYQQNLERNEYRPTSGARFDGTGYINADAEDAILGNAGNGYAKSDGWILPEVTGGAVVSDGPDEQAIFFSDVYSDKYAFTAKMKLKGGAEHASGVVDAYPSAGVCNMTDEKEFVAFYINGSNLLGGASAIGYHTLSKYTGWDDNYEGYFDRPADFDPAEDYVTLTCIKDGANYYYIIDGKLVLCKRVDFLAGETCPGLYTLSAVAEFIEYSGEDYTGRENELDALIAQYAYKVNVPGSISGGTVTSEQGALIHGQSLTLKIQPSSGYVLTSITVNGEDIYEYAVANMKEGVLVLSDITSDVTVEAEFTRFGDYTARVAGKVKSIDGKSVTDADLLLTSSDSRIYYKSKTTSNGSYNFVLPAEGVYEIGGRTFTSDGNYTLFVVAEGYRKGVTEIAVTGEAASVQMPDLVLERNVVGGSVTIDGVQYNSSVLNWDMTGEDDCSVVALQKSNASKAFFTDTVTDSAVLDFTVSNRTEITAAPYEDQPCMGISFTDGKESFDVFVFNEGLRISPYGSWNNQNAAYNLSVPVSYSLRANQNPEVLSFRYLKSGSVVAVYYNDGGEYKELIRLEDRRLAQMVAYAFTVCQSQECKLEFSDYSITTGDAAQEIIKDYLYETVSLTSDDGSSDYVTIKGTGAENEILYGKTFKVVNESEKVIVASFGGKSFVLDVGGECSFTASMSGSVKTVYIEDTVSVIGKVKLDEKFGDAQCDFTATTLYFVSDNYTLEFTGAVDSSGNFTVSLPYGSYSLRAVNPKFSSTPIEFTVGDGGSLSEVTFTLSAVDETLGSSDRYTVDSQGKLTGYSSGAGESNVYFMGEGDAFVAQTDVVKPNLLIEDWPNAGLVFSNDNGRYAWVVWHDNGAGEYKALFIRHGVNASYAVEGYYPVAFDAENKVTLSAAYKDGVLNLYMNGILMCSYGESNGFITNKTFFDLPLKTGLINVGVNGEFTDYFYTEKVSEIDTLTPVSSVTVISDATAGEVTIEGGKPVGDTYVVTRNALMTVTVNATAPYSVASVTLDGEPVALNTADGVTVASCYPALKNSLLKISYVKNLKIHSGNVVMDERYANAITDFSIVTVTVYDSVGAVYSGNASADGSFTAELGDGEYTMTAICDAFAATEVSFTIADGVAVGMTAVLDRPLLGEGLFGGTFVYSERTSVYKSENNPQFYGGWLTGAETAYGDSFVLKAEVRDMLSSQWPAVGFIVGTDSDHYMKFAIRRNGDIGSVFDFMLLHEEKNGVPYAYREYEFEAGSALQQHPFGENNDQSLEMALVYNGGIYFVFFNGELAFSIDENTVMNGITVKDCVGTAGNVKLGLFAERSNTFVDWSYDYSKSALSSYLAATVTVPEGVTLEKDGNEITDGAVNLGDTVTVSMPSGSGQKVIFKANGKALVSEEKDGRIYASFRAEEKYVTVAIDLAYEISGTVSGLSYVNGDLTTTVLTFSDGEKETVIENAVSADGKFSVFLPEGVYSVRAENPAYMPVTVNGADTSSSNPVNIAFALAAVTDMTNWAFDETTQKLSNVNEPTSDRYFASASSFTVSVYVDEITEDWKAAGISVRDDGKQYPVRVLVRKNTKGYDLYLNTQNGYAELGSLADPFVDRGGSVKTAKITLTLYNGTFYVMINDAPVKSFDIAQTVNHWGTPATSLSEYLTAGEAYRFGLGTCDGTVAVFSQWSYSTDAEEISAQFTVSGSVKKQNIFAADASVKLGDTVITVDGSALSFNGAVKEDGSFALPLGVGEYNLTFSHPQFMSKRATVTVPAEGSAQTVEAAFRNAKVDAGDWTYDAVADTLTPPAEANNVSKYFAAKSGSPIMGTVSVANLDTTYDAWASTGLIFKSSAGTSQLYVSLTEDVAAAGEDGAIKLRILGEPWDVVDDTGLSVGAYPKGYESATLKVLINAAEIRITVGETVVSISETSNTALYEKLSTETYGFFTDGATYTMGLRVVKNGGTAIFDFDCTTDADTIAAFTA